MKNIYKIKLAMIMALQPTFRRLSAKKNTKQPKGIMKRTLLWMLKLKILYEIKLCVTIDLWRSKLNIKVKFLAL